MSYDSVDPIYATSNGYWVVYAELDGVVQVVADSEKPGAWRMIMDDRTSPTKALVAVDRQARTGKYYVNYYAAVPQSFKGSQAPTAAQSRRVVPDIALYVSEFTVTKRSGKSRLSSTPGTANKHRATRTRSNP
ncbi:MAG TPA: hypothetical protein VKT77_14525 [Chthonomonadaceae bacterium]|nr:hypothetical protein [Chthonomonadaceae bacterium]